MVCCGSNFKKGAQTDLGKAREDVSNDDIFETEVHKSRGPWLRRVNFSTAKDKDTNGEAKGDNIPTKGN